jgi:hypothetical protein
VTPIFASHMFRIRRFTRSCWLRAFALVLASCLAANGVTAAAMPFAQTRVATAGSGMLHRAPDAHCRHLVSAAVAHAPGHDQDCSCCLGKVCACGPIAAGGAGPLAPPMIVPMPDSLPVAIPARNYATRTSPMLRPPIA